MAELITTTKLDPDTHLLLDQPLLRLPHELLRKNLKSAQRQIEITNKAVTSAVTSKASNDADVTLASLELTLAKAQSLKRKLESLRTEEATLHRQQKARIQHLQAVHEIPSLADVQYDAWAHVRLDRLLIDQLLRKGYTESARALAGEEHIADLVDIDVFEECGKIEQSLCTGRVQECLAWCAENKQALKKINSNLELELRLQQVIELARSGEPAKQLEALLHARKHLTGGQDPDIVLHAAGLLAYTSDTYNEPYRVRIIFQALYHIYGTNTGECQTLYSASRYSKLSALFVQTHHTLYSLPSQPLLHIALSAGLSALKTPTCHSIHNPAINNATSSFQPATNPSTLIGTPLCPICSTELNELARNVPYAHHTKSYMEDDPVVLPNGRVFGRERLQTLNEKLGVEKGKWRDPTEGHDGSEWEESEVRKPEVSLHSEWPSFPQTWTRKAMGKLAIEAPSLARLLARLPCEA
nr:protein fyv10 [Quercus suber]